MNSILALAFLHAQSRAFCLEKQKFLVQSETFWNSSVLHEKSPRASLDKTCARVPGIPIITRFSIFHPTLFPGYGHPVWMVSRAKNKQQNLIWDLKPSSQCRAIECEQTKQNRQLWLNPVTEHQHHPPLYAEYELGPGNTGPSSPLRRQWRRRRR